MGKEENDDYECKKEEGHFYSNWVMNVIVLQRGREREREREKEREREREGEGEGGREKGGWDDVHAVLIGNVIMTLDHPQPPSLNIAHVY